MDADVDHIHFLEAMECYNISKSFLQHNYCDKSYLAGKKDTKLGIYE